MTTTRMHDGTSGLSVGDVVRTQLFRLPASSTIGRAADEFVRRDIECLIVDMDDGSIRLLTERALLRALLPSVQELHEPERRPDELELEEIAREHAGLPVGSATLFDAHVVPQAMPAMKALATMIASDFRRMLVSGEDGALVGLVTQRDLTRTVLLNLNASSR